jgi:hypothetical protein
MDWFHTSDPIKHEVFIDTGGFTPNRCVKDFTMWIPFRHSALEVPGGSSSGRIGGCVVQHTANKYRRIASKMESPWLCEAFLR